MVQAFLVVAFLKNESVIWLSGSLKCNKLEERISRLQQSVICAIIKTYTKFNGWWHSLKNYCIYQESGKTIE